MYVHQNATENYVYKPFAIGEGGEVFLYMSSCINVTLWMILAFVVAHELCKHVITLLDVRVVITA